MNFISEEIRTATVLLLVKDSVIKYPELTHKMLGILNFGEMKYKT